MPRHKMIQQEEPVVEEQVEEAVEETDDDVASQLAQLGAELAAVATDKTKRKAKLREVEAFLGRLRVEDFPELAESPTIQNFVKLLTPADMRPGETRNPGTLAEVRKEWSIEDCWREGRSPEGWIPMESMPLIFNGIRVDVVAGEEQVIPATHYDVYRHVMRVKRNAAQMEKWLSGKSEMAPDRNYMSDAAYRIKALGNVTFGVGPITEDGSSSEATDA